MKIKHVFAILIVVLLLTAPVFPDDGGAKIKKAKITREKILETSEEWKTNYNGHQVDEAFLETLKAKIGDNLNVDVYLGTWCSDSLKNVPAFIKIIEATETATLTVNYYNVGRKPNKKVKYYVKELKVERVPTFIFSRQGKELGRIVENPTNSLIEDIVEIIF